MALSRDLMDMVATTESHPSVNIDELLVGALLEVKTENSVYLLVVMDDQGMVAMKGSNPQLKELAVYFLQGATAGGSAVKPGHIVEGMYLRMNLAQGGVLTTSLVQDVHVVDDLDQARALFEQAEKIRPRPMTDEDLEAARGMVAEIVETEFPSDQRERVRELVDRFCLPNGQAVMLGVLSKAQEADKLDRAFEVLGRHYQDHWVFRPKECRGELLTEVDVEYLKEAYRALGLLPPGEEDESDLPVV